MICSTYQAVAEWPGTNYPRKPRPDGVFLVLDGDTLLLRYYSSSSLIHHHARGDRPLSRSTISASRDGRNLGR